MARTMLPYTQHSNDTLYLKVTLKNNHISVGIGTLTPHLTKDEPQAQDAQNLINTLKNLYKIPDRWQADTVGETLFRRMHQYLDNGRIIPNSSNLSSDIYNSLEQLLYYLDQQDRQKDPLTFTLTWTLVAFRVCLNTKN